MIQQCARMGGYSFGVHPLPGSWRKLPWQKCMKAPPPPVTTENGRSLAPRHRRDYHRGDARGGRVTTPRGKTAGPSPMPEGLHAGLTPRQFAELVSYLESLKSENPDEEKERK